MIKLFDNIFKKKNEDLPNKVDTSEELNINAQIDVDDNLIEKNFYSSMFNFIQTHNIQNYFNKTFDDIFKFHTLNYISYPKCDPNLYYLFKDQTIICNTKYLDNLYPCVHWSYKKTEMNYDILEYISNHNNRLFFLENGYLQSITTRTIKHTEQIDDKYINSVSFILDDFTCHYDFYKISRIEQMLNNKKLIITEKQKIRAKNLINLIVKNKLSRFNDFSIYEPNVGRKGKKKIVLFDQSYDVNSFIYNDNNNYDNFDKMFKTAIEENQDCDIIIKVNQIGVSDEIKTRLKIKPTDNIYIMEDMVSPISLIEMADKIYVCDTYAGLFALMYNKEVHVFGSPFYANWGLTIDDTSINRRKNKRTLEELVYIFFIMYTYYVDPRKEEQCEIETAIDYLLELREEFTKIIH